MAIKLNTKDIINYLKEQGIEGYKKKINYIYRIDDWILHGVFIEFRSDYYYLDAFCIPLVLPTDLIYFSYGGRLENPINNGGMFLNEQLIDKSHIIYNFIKNVLEERSKIITLDTFFKTYKSQCLIEDERFAYVEILLKPEKKDEICKKLEILIEPRMTVAKTDWEKELLKRLEIIKNMNADEAINQFKKWRNESLILLKIEE